jgi:arabinogalactan oligomer/maltooligosaccharide transport system permease protein
VSSVSRAQSSWASTSRRRRIGLTLRLLVAIVAIIYAVFPALWIASTALNPTGSLATAELIPRHASLRNFDELLNDPIHPYLRWLWNSIKISTIVAVCSVFILALSAYAFSRFRFRFRRNLLLGVFLVQVFPSSLTIVGIFLLVQQIGSYIPSLGLNSHGGLILVYLGYVLGINVWLMKGFFDSVPRDIDESAMVDGASHWQIFTKLILPLVRPILAVTAILSFIGTFNDFLLARTVLQSTDEFTLMVGLYLFVDQQFAQNWGVFAAGALIASVPIVLIYLVLQDHIVSGLTEGAVKG